MFTPWEQRRLSFHCKYTNIFQQAIHRFIDSMHGWTQKSEQPLQTISIFSILPEAALHTDPNNEQTRKHTEDTRVIATCAGFHKQSLSIAATQRFPLTESLLNYLQIRSLCLAIEAICKRWLLCNHDVCPARQPWIKRRSRASTKLFGIGSKPATATSRWVPFHVDTRCKMCSRCVFYFVKTNFLPKFPTTRC